MYSNPNLLAALRLDLELKFEGCVAPYYHLLVMLHRLIKPMGLCCPLFTKPKSCHAYTKPLFQS